MSEFVRIGNNASRGGDSLTYSADRDLYSHSLEDIPISQTERVTTVYSSFLAAQWPEVTLKVWLFKSKWPRAISERENKFPKRIRKRWIRKLRDFQLFTSQDEMCVFGETSTVTA